MMKRKAVTVHHPIRGMLDVWAEVPDEPSDVERERLMQQARSLLKEKKALLIAHYYVSPDLQELAEETGGFVGDSLEMARFGQRHPVQTLVVAGVRFMGETANILSPEKEILMPNLSSECSLDQGCPAEEFSLFCDRHPDRVVVVYANTSAAVKARADWVITSSMAVELVSHLHQQGKKILWAPDKHLGQYIQHITGADMLFWEGSCVVHEEFKAHALAAMKADYPDAVVLAHPESPQGVLDLADSIGSTSQILKAARESDADRFIVATDFGIRYQLQKQNPDKEFLVAPTAGDGAVCKSCAFCPWMAMNDLSSVIHALNNPSDHRVSVPSELIEPARQSLMRMVEFAQQHLPHIPVSSFGPA